MAKRTPQQKRRATAKMLEKKLPAKGKADDTVLSGPEMRRVIRELAR